MKALDMLILFSVALLAMLLAACSDHSNPAPAGGGGAAGGKADAAAGDQKPHAGHAGHDAHAGKGAAGRKPNRLIHETSPYLLQHAHNPVDWRPWGKEAFEAAKKEDKPIFLSVGYSTCHWCHVMAHESFEDEKVAEILNKHFISIKVDREELPEIDAQYMLATQMLVRRGGWPNSVWLTSDGRPWQAGTYFPREDQVLQGRVVRSGFKTVLLQLADIWKTRRAEVEELGTQLAGDIQRYGKGEHLGASKPVGRGVIDKASKLVSAGFDSERGGFGSPPNFAPKFPPHGALALLNHLATSGAGADLTMLDKLGRTFDAMALGGMHDHIGGGFHRYSTDRRWFLPHFEKMLYDNAQLLRAYADGAVILNEPGYRVVIEDIFTWLSREMTDPAGGFYSALDADSEGEEGRFYVWSIAEMKKILGEADGRLMVEVYGATEAGNFMDEASHQRNGSNVLYLEKSLDAIAAQRKEEPAAFIKRVNGLKAKLLAVRNQRIRPHLDDKVLAGWNGLMIGSLAHAGRVLKEPRYTQAAAKAADFILKSMRGPDGRLLRTWRKGQAKVDGYLDDYAFLMHGLLELHTTTGEKRWLDEAAALAAAMKKLFTDPERGGFYFTSELHPVTLVRSEDPASGGNTPSGNGMAAQALIMLFEKTGDKSHIAAAESIFNRFSGHLWEMPNAVEDMVVALARYYALIDAGKISEPRREHFKIKPDSEQYIEPVALGAYLDATAVRPGAKVKLAIKLQVGSEWHIYANKQPAGSPVIPTVATLGPESSVTLGALEYPAGELVKDPVQPYQAYRGLTTLMAEIAIPADAKPGERTVNLIIKFQACNDITRTCLLPQDVTLPLRLTISADAPEKSERHKEIFKPAAQ